MSEKMKTTTPPILIFGYGNPSRGDDALGPMLLEQIDTHPDVELLTDFQLQVEHSLDMIGRELILFIDASVSCPSPFEFRHLDSSNPQSVPTYTTHQLTPDALLSSYLDVHHMAAPPCYLLSIRGEQFELGLPLSSSAQNNLQHAIQWLERLLQHATEKDWNALSREAAGVAA